MNGRVIKEFESFSEKGRNFLLSLSLQGVDIMMFPEPE
jgi:hypothetical protein